MYPELCFCEKYSIYHSLSVYYESGTVLMFYMHSYLIPRTTLKVDGIITVKSRPHLTVATSYPWTTILERYDNGY